MWSILEFFLINFLRMISLIRVQEADSSIKYCFLTLREDTSFFFLIISLFFVFLLLFYVIINFYKNYFIIIILFYFFSWKLFLFFHVPGCSGMFRVPGFIDALKLARI